MWGRSVNMLASIVQNGFLYHVRKKLFYGIGQVLNEKRFCLTYNQNPNVYYFANVSKSVFKMQCRKGKKTHAFYKCFDRHSIGQSACNH